jgi:RNA polymerase sigma-70 factor (ECF subfamily)
MSRPSLALHHRGSIEPALRSTSNEVCLSVFLRELNYVYRTLRRLGTAASEIEDLAQDVFLALRGSWTNYDPARPIRPYLFGIAFRIALAYQRKRRREVVVAGLDPDDEGSGPHEALQSTQERAIVLAALERIPLSRRAVLVMHELDDIPVVDVASVLGIPVFTVYSRLRKGRRELETETRRLLREEHRDPLAPR